MRQIDRAQVNALGGNIAFANAVAGYMLALKAHEKTEGVPAPIPPNAVVADVVRNYAGVYEIIEPPPLPVDPPPPEDSLRVKGLKTDQNVIDMLTKVRGATVAEIDAWFAANVTTVASARAVLATIVKLLATVL